MQAAFQAASSEMYAQAGAAEAQPGAGSTQQPSGSSQQPGQDISDADFEEVK